ncbi:MAG: hypothetical protein EP335_16060 [Alphaproteobacteria bacterium]|nr:MAG: hypothetical protein EP335_16060 [Alphaproteobacteria bacterium]
MLKRLATLTLIAATGLPALAPAFAAARAEETVIDALNKLAEPKEVRCVDASRIISYVIESDEVVRLQMKGRKDVIMQLKRNCNQLHYHAYMAYKPTNGELCAGFGDIFTRTGLPCRIDSMTEIERGAELPARFKAATTDTPEDAGDEGGGR